MCLGVPGRVVSVNDDVALVDFLVVKREVRQEIVDPAVAPGDYVLNHVGVAIRRIPEEEIADTLCIYEELLGAAEDDLMAADVRGEVAAAAPGPHRGNGK